MTSPKKMMVWGFSLVLGVGFVLFFSFSKNETQAVEPVRFVAPTVSSLTPTLRMKGYGTKGEEGFWREKIHEFELQNKCAVLVDWSTEEAKHYADLRAAKESWDVVMISDSELESFHAANRLTPLTIPLEIESKMIPKVLSLFRRGDYYEGVPFGFSTLALYYNKQVFDRRGVAYPDDHWTWEDLLAMARGMYIDPKSGRGSYGVEVDWGWELLNVFAGQSGESLLSSGCTMNPNPERATVLGVQWLIDLAQNYAVDVAYPEEGELSHFEKGEAVMAVTGPELMNRLKVHHEFVWGVTTLPQGKLRSNTLTAQGWSVWGESRSRELAYSLVLKLAQQSAPFGGLAVYQPEISELSHPPESIFYDSIAHSNPMIADPYFFYWKERVKMHWSESIEGSGTAASVWMDTINNEVSTFLEQSKR